MYVYVHYCDRNSRIAVTERRRFDCWITWLNFVLCLFSLHENKTRKLLEEKFLFENHQFSPDCPPSGTTERQNRWSCKDLKTVKNARFKRERKGSYVRREERLLHQNVVLLVVLPQIDSGSCVLETSLATSSSFSLSHKHILFIEDLCVYHFYCGQWITSLRICVMKSTTYLTRFCFGFTLTSLWFWKIHTRKWSCKRVYRWFVTCFLRIDRNLPCKWQVFVEGTPIVCLSSPPSTSLFHHLRVRHCLPVDTYKSSLHCKSCNNFSIKAYSVRKGKHFLPIVLLFCSHASLFLPLQPR